MNETAPKAHLLVVDDDFLLRSMAVKTLRHAGFEVSDAAGGDDALVLFEERPFDLVLLDVMMPGLDGFEVCARLRATERGAALPILMLTGLNDTESIEQAFRQGATDFITKPIHWTLLAQRVRYALRASRAAEAMRRSERSLARAQRLAGMGNWQWHADGRLTYSAELQRLLGLDTEAARSDDAQTFLSLVAADDREPVRQARHSLVVRGIPYQLEFRIARPDGAVRTVFEQAFPAIDDQGRHVGVEGITQDITERVQARETIRQMAHYDGTTGLPNQQFFAELAAPLLALAGREDTHCAVVHLDLDRFKGVNDTFGRDCGDAVLRIIAERLRTWIRGNDLAAVHAAPVEHGVVARVGSNAFTVLITALATHDQAAAVTERLLAAIAQPVEVDGHSIVLTASAGIAIYPSDAQDLAGLTRAAEQAASTAKEVGRGQHRFFDEATNAQAASRLLREIELRRAIGGDELRLHFQPKVDASSGTLVGAEALVRWQHPERGLLAPGAFIALAEETGLILPLTDWVLESACRVLQAWRKAGLQPLKLSVNLAAASLADTALLTKLEALTTRYGVPPSCLTLEVTETMMMLDVDKAVALLDRLRGCGYGLSLDDFGIGFSSLSHLKRLPLDELKIDRAFVTEAAQGGRDAALARGIISMGRDLGLRVVAEGVETQAQKDFLLRHDCPLQQGYLFSRPVPEDVFTRMLGAPAGSLGGLAEAAAAPLGVGAAL